MQQAGYSCCMQEGSVSSPTATTVNTTAPLLDRMRDLIVNGAIQPDELLGEAALAEEFEVSRTPIREALKQLEREGLVEIRPGSAPSCASRLRARS